MMLVLQHQRLSWEFSKSVLCFLSCLSIGYRPHTLIRLLLLRDWQINILSLRLFPTRVPIELSHIAFPKIVLPSRDRTDSFREERLSLPYWTMIWAICVVVEESTCLDIPIWELSIICEHLPFLPGYKQILRLLLVHRNPAIWRWYPWLWRLSCECWWSLFGEHCIRTRIIFHNVTLEYGPASVLLRLRLKLRVLKMTQIHQWRKMNFSALIPCFIDHLFLVSELSAATPGSSPSFPFFSTAAFASGFFNAGSIGMNLRTRL